MDNYLGRSCPYCFSTPRVPKRVVVRPLNGPDLIIPDDVALPLQAFGLIVYRLEGVDGAAIYAPAFGVSMEKIKQSIVWDREE